jgi:hypothetical protein
MLILSLKKTITAKAAKAIAMLVRGCLAAAKKTDCEIKKKEARNAYDSLIYLFDSIYIANGLKEQNDTQTALKRYSCALTFMMDWYIVGNKEMLKQASSVSCSTIPQCKLFTVVRKR